MFVNTIGGASHSKDERSRAGTVNLIGKYPLVPNTYLLEDTSTSVLSKRAAVSTVRADYACTVYFSRWETHFSERFTFFHDG